MGDRIPLPFPFGWYCVADSADLGTQVETRRAFGQDLVLFRDGEGVARAVDPYCPHLGAHLGVGGEVVEGALRCPFHHWRFDGEGRCVDIPYAKRIPPAARLQTWPTCERNGLVFAWYHPERAAPSWEVPEIDEWVADDWSDPVVHQFDVRSHPQEMAENTVDAVHFQTVHGTPKTPPMEARIEGHVFHAYQGLTFDTPQGEVPGRVDIASYGCGIGVTRFQGFVDTLLLITGLPLEDELHRTTIRFRVKVAENAPDAVDAIGRAFVAEIERQYTQDIPIWENKIHLERPVLCDGDGPIALLREFYRQFYVDSQPAGRASA